MSEREPIVDFSEFDPDRVIANQQQVQQHIPQRFEMAQVDGILFEDSELFRGVGFKNITSEEFWVRGHMPGFPLMPGVIMCECAAQVVAYFASKFKAFDSGAVGFGGLKNVRFRGIVVPGKRLIVMIAKRKVRRNMIVVCDFQGYIDRNLVVDGELTGIMLPDEVANQITLA